MRRVPEPQRFNPLAPPIDDPSWNGGCWAMRPMLLAPDMIPRREARRTIRGLKPGDFCWVKRVYPAKCEARKGFEYDPLAAGPNGDPLEDEDPAGWYVGRLQWRSPKAPDRACFVLYGMFAIFPYIVRNPDESVIDVHAPIPFQDWPIPTWAIRRLF